jgi:hypothetical protein
MRESERAVEALLEDLETWAVEKIPSEYFLMLFKSMLSVKQAERLAMIVDRCSALLSSNVMMAYVEMIKTWKL